MSACSTTRPPWDETGPLENRRYLWGLYDLTDLGRQLHREALSVGWREAEVQIALSDGAVCLEKFLAAYFPRAELILDFFHAAQHVAGLARALHSDEEACRDALAKWCAALKHRGGAALLAELEALDQSHWSADAREVRRKETNYLRHNVGRMDYPRYLTNGWQIGGGPIEAACKTVVGAHMKTAGMRWGPAGTDALATLRACYLSDCRRWNSFWNDSYLQM